VVFRTVSARTPMRRRDAGRKLRLVIELAHPALHLPTPRPINPALIEDARERRKSLENRMADRITTFSGSMQFVYLHALWFGAWIGFGIEGYPYGLLTMIVSLEAIFLSTFVMISQNRADEKREVLANQQWSTVLEEDNQNKELLKISNQILELTMAVHAFAEERRKREGEQP
jgi:uncharacterized membrane protein